MPDKQTDEERDKWTGLQIFLDNAEFNPGKIDGRWGTYTAKALERHQRAEGRDDATFGDEEPDELPGDVDSVSPVFTTYSITEEDEKMIGDVPEKREDQADKEELPYTSLVELVAEKFHTDEGFFRSLNEEKDLDDLKEGDEVKVPNVKSVFSLKDVKDAESDGDKEGFRVEILTEEKVLELYEGEKLVASYPITPGSEKLPAPKGEWEVTSVTWMPTFRWDKQMLEEGERSDDAHVLPPGPNSPVGILWAAIDSDGIGIHGTPEPDTIGRAASHGCIRLSNWDAWDLGQRLSAGVPVMIK